MYQTNYGITRASTHLQVARGVEEKIAGLEVSVNDVGGMDVLQTSQNLVQEVTNVVVAEMLRFQKLVQIGFHQVLNDQTVKNNWKKTLERNIAPISELWKKERSESRQSSDWPCMQMDDGNAY